MDGWTLNWWMQPNYSLHWRKEERNMPLAWSIFVIRGNPQPDWEDFFWKFWHQYQQYQKILHSQMETSLQLNHNGRTPSRGKLAPQTIREPQKDCKGEHDYYQSVYSWNPKKVFLITIILLNFWSKKPAIDGQQETPYEVQKSVSWLAWTVTLTVKCRACIGWTEQRLSELLRHARDAEETLGKKRTKQLEKCEIVLYNASLNMFHQSKETILQMQRKRMQSCSQRRMEKRRRQRRSTSLVAWAIWSREVFQLWSLSLS